MFHYRFVLHALLLMGLTGSPWQSTWAETPTVLVVGDSLSAGYGIELDEGWVNLLQHRLQINHYPHQVINASISGDTSRGGLARLPAALDRYRPHLVILELGGNDGLRGLPLTALKTNLAAMIELCRAAGARVLLAEMRIPPNYGPVYSKKFQALYGELAHQYDIPLIPFLLDGVAGHADLMQEDGIHPRAAAQARILDNVWPVVKTVLDAPGIPAKTSATMGRSRGEGILSWFENFAVRSV